MNRAGLPSVSRPDARVLILGSFPGQRSLAEQRYYAHGQNRFWPALADVIGVTPSAPYDERLRALLRRGLALWDVLERCERPGSMDTAIVRASETPNDFGAFFAQHAQVHAVCFNGRTAAALFARHVVPEDLWDGSGIEFVVMPSTSPAHASLRPAQLADRWGSTLTRLLKQGDR